MPREIHRFDDQILPEIIGEMLHTPISDTRLYAALLLRATPYREPVADALAWSLRQPRNARDPLMASRLLEGLRILGGVAERPLVQALTGPQVPFRIQEAAFQALAHMGGCSQPAFWRQTFAAHGPDGSTGCAARDRLLGHAVYAMGIKRDFAGLQGVAADQASSPAVRVAARWWLNLPGHMLASAVT